MRKSIHMNAMIFMGLFSLACGIMGERILFAKEFTIDDLIGIASSHENEIQAIRWTCTRFSDKQSSDENSDSAQNSSQKLITKYDVTYDLKHKKFYCHSLGTTTWKDGMADTISVNIEYSFDGKVFSCWYRSRGGSELPTEKDPGEGAISYDLVHMDPLVEMFVKSGGMIAGIGTGFPGMMSFREYNQFNTRRISDVFKLWKEESRITSIKELPDGRIEVEAIADVIENSKDFFWRIIYHPQFDVIEEQSLYSRFNGEHMMTVFKVEFQNEERRIPKCIKKIEGSEQSDKNVICTNIISLEINPEISEDVFQVEIPDGIKVSDYITKKFYITGSITDEDKAINDFMVRHHLTGNTPKINSRWRYALTVVGSGLLVLLIVIVSRIRVKKEKI